MTEKRFPSCHLEASRTELIWKCRFVGEISIVLPYTSAMARTVWPNDTSSQESWCRRVVSKLQIERSGVVGAKPDANPKWNRQLLYFVHEDDRGSVDLGGDHLVCG
jgi:hypothetical protein